MKSLAWSITMVNGIKRGLRPCFNYMFSSTVVSPSGRVIGHNGCRTACGFIESITLFVYAFVSLVRRVWTFNSGHWVLKTDSHSWPICVLIYMQSLFKLQKRCVIWTLKVLKFNIWFMFYLFVWRSKIQGRMGFGIFNHDILCKYVI